MDSHITEHALAAMLAGKPPEPGWRCFPVAPDLTRKPTLQVAGLDMDDLAEFSIAHELCRLLKRCGISVTEVHHVDDACFLGCAGHAKRIGVVRSERLLAEDVLAGGNRLKRERRVQAVGGHI